MKNSLDQVWYILLDCSGSMASPFAGRTSREVDGLSEAHPGSDRPGAKFAAARSAAIKKVRSLTASTVSVIGFNHTIRFRWTGGSSESSELQKELEPVLPGGGTELSVAIREVANSLSSTEAQYTVLIVSDGLIEDKVDLEPLTATKYDLRLYAILIDDTPSGRENLNKVADIFYAVAADVTVKGVHNEDELREAVDAVPPKSEGLLEARAPVMRLRWALNTALIVLVALIGFIGTFGGALITGYPGSSQAIIHFVTSSQTVVVSFGLALLGLSAGIILFAAFRKEKNTIVVVPEHGRRGTYRDQLIHSFHPRRRALIIFASWMCAGCGGFLIGYALAT